MAKKQAETWSLDRELQLFRRVQRRLIDDVPARDWGRVRGYLYILVADHRPRAETMETALVQASDLAERLSAVAREDDGGMARNGGDPMTFEDWQAKLAEVGAAKDAAYAERNQCVALIAKLALARGWQVWRGEHDPNAADWEADWRNIVFIELPTGQVSWHVHDSEMPNFAWIPLGSTPWDGHTTREKYDRMRAWEAHAPMATMGALR